SGADRIVFPAPYLRLHPRRAERAARRTGQSVGTPVAVGRGNPPGGEQERPEDLVEEIDPADGNRTDRVAVVRLGKGEKLLPRLRPSLPLAPVLERHLDGDLHRGGSVVGIKDARESGRRGGQEFFRELDRRDVGQPQEGGMGHPVELGTDCAVDLLPAVPEQVHPQRRYAVEIFPPLRGEEAVPLSRLYAERSVLLPVRNLGEGVPDPRFIPPPQPLRPSVERGTTSS